MRADLPGLAQTTRNLPDDVHVAEPVRFIDDHQIPGTLVEALSLDPLWLCTFRARFGGLDGFHPLLILLPQLLKLLYPLIEREAAERGYAHSAVQPIAGFARQKKEIALAFGEQRIEAALRQFCVNRFEREVHFVIISSRRQAVSDCATIWRRALLMCEVLAPV